MEMIGTRGTSSMFSQERGRSPNTFESQASPACFLSCSVNMVGDDILSEQLCCISQKFGAGQDIDSKSEVLFPVFEVKPDRTDVQLSVRICIR